MEKKQRHFWQVFCCCLCSYFIFQGLRREIRWYHITETAWKMTPEERAWAEEKLGLKDPISVQYIRWAGNALQGDFGISYKYKMDVTRVIEGRIGNTLVLGGIGFLLIFTLALLLGIFCAWKEDTWLDRIICKVGTITGCIPEFWLSLLLILVFSMQLKWLPSSGAYSVGKQADFSDRVCHLAAFRGGTESFVVLRIHDPQ